MAGASIRLVGGAELAAQLRQLADEVAGENLKAAVQLGASPIQNSAKEKAPYKAGHLHRTIHTETKLLSPRAAEATIGTDLIYAGIQEFGGTIKAKNAPYLVFRTEDGRWHRVKSVTLPARPYMRPAFDTEKENAVAEIGSALKALLAKVVG